MSQSSSGTIRRLGFAAALIASGLLVGGTVTLYRMGTPGSASSARRVLPITVSSDRLDFGEVPLHGTAVRKLVLRNEGDEPVRLRLVPGGSAFRVEPAELTLEGGASASVSVTLNPEAPGTLRDELRIFSAEDDPAPRIVVLSARTVGETPSASHGTDGAPRNGEDGGTRARRAEGTDRFDALRRAGDSVPATASQVPTTAIGTAQAQAPGAVSVVSSRRDASSSGAGSVAPEAVPRTGAGERPPAAVVMADAGSRPVRSISERPQEAPGDATLRDGEEPVSLRRRSLDAETDLEKDSGPGAGDPVEERPETEAPSLAVLASSTLAVLGSANSFYPQQIGIYGSETGGSFSVADYLQLPAIPLGFGQSMQFAQSGSAVGSFDPGSGQVTLDLPMEAVDANGNSAPFVVPLTTGTSLVRNNSGIVVSAAGQPREPGSGLMRLVGFGKIPVGYHNGAEEQVVTVEIIATLSFPATAISQVASGGQTEGGL